MPVYLNYHRKDAFTMQMGVLRLLLVGDIHYSGSADGGSPLPERKSEFGLEFVKRLKDTACDGGFDAVVFMGDLVDDGPAPGAREDVRALVSEAKAWHIPSFFIRGNHDPGEKTFAGLTGMNLPYVLMKNRLLYFFSDSFSERDLCRRRESDLSRFREAVKKHAGAKAIVFQHNPVHPEIESSYPYNLVNAREVHETFKDCGVSLSVSGHYHRGRELFSKDGVEYLTVPSLCEFPYSFLEVEVRAGGTRVSRGSLSPAPALWDNHCHSEFAYCAEDVSVDSVCRRAEIFGLEYVAFTEHAAQLYLSREEYVRGDFYSNPGLIRKSTDGRMECYKKRVRDFAGTAKLGLEVEADGNGELALPPEDIRGLEVLVGAVHYLPRGRQELLFMRANEALLKNGVQVIAHPFRFFRRANLPVPESLFRPLALLLRDFGAAAEINFHTNDPPPAFFGICLEEGVKLSIGSDGHNLLEVGDLSRHTGFLKMLGLNPEKHADMLFRL